VASAVALTTAGTLLAAVPGISARTVLASSTTPVPVVLAAPATAPVVAPPAATSRRVAPRQVAARQVAARQVTAAPPSSPETARSYAAGLGARHGWGAGEIACLDALWERESRWDAAAVNDGSGAFGIPQALPAEQMAAEGLDWRTSFRTQVRWGVGYVLARYGRPCDAEAHSQTYGWY